MRFPILLKSQKDLIIIQRELKKISLTFITKMVSTQRNHQKKVNFLKIQVSGKKETKKWNI